VLKDASSTALYGSKGKNGVILITTKSKSYNYLNDNAQNVRPLPREEIKNPDEMPQFPGGEIGLKEFIDNSIVYPERARKNGINGTVYVNFVISKSGKVTDARISRGVDPDLDKEALRVVNTLPLWRPGRKDGKLVDVSYTVPVDFILKDAPVNVSLATSTILSSEPLYIIDGEEFQGKLDNIDPDDIKSIDVLKGESGIKAYGEKGKNGVIVIRTKNAASKSLQGKIDNSQLGSNNNSDRMSLKSPEGTPPPLFILDGKEVATLDDISPEEVESINVLKGKSATNLYGEKGKNGVVVVTTKKFAEQNKITTEIELRKFIAEKIKYPVEAQEANKTGTIQLFIELNNSGQVVKITEKASGDELFLDEVVVVGYQNKDDVIIKDNLTDTENSVLKNEVERIIRQFPKIEIPEYEGKIVGITVKFMLQ